MLYVWIDSVVDTCALICSIVLVLRESFCQFYVLFVSIEQVAFLCCGVCLYFAEVDVDVSQSLVVADSLLSPLAIYWL